MTNESQPLDPRAQTIADLRALIDYLAARPDVPFNPWTDPLAVSIGVDIPDDERGLAEVARIAAALDVPVTDRHGHPPTEATTQYAAIFAIGRAEYRAVYITREHTAAYHVELEHVKHARRCACGGKLSDADLVAGKKRCAACVPGAVES